MKKSIIFILLLVSSVSFAQVSVFTKYSDGKLAPCATIFGTKPINDKVSFTYFALVSEKWAETMLGVAYSPISWAQIGLNCGFEQNPALFRVGGSIWLGKGKTSFLTLLEKGDGQDNYWYKSTLAYKATSSLSLGVRAWRFNGVGPLVEYKVKDFKFWIMPAYEFEKNNSNLIVGIDIKI
ncbi:hypothetical protein GW920_00565 [Candidatus Falkowbacteria bacterium]|nr:hypothetical protein [Candidatus Falkowbacteria bacterium]NCQ13017.1 hypothetical protein [Candidatus Falkowbacteria bacterium]